MAKAAIALVLLLTVFLTACSGAAPALTAVPEPSATPVTSPSASATPSLSPELQAYLENALDLIEENSIYSAKVDWPSLRAAAFQDAATAQTTADLYPLLRQVLHATGDRHGYIMLPPQSDDYFNDTSAQAAYPIRFEIIQERIAHLVVPAFISGNPEAVERYVGDLQQAIQTLDAQNPCGWALDLRGNDGGNGFAMLLGVSPLLAEGVQGYHTFANGTVWEWRTLGNQVYLGEVLLIDMQQPMPQISHPDAPVAVLVNETTTSGGELLAIAFNGRPNTLSFGQRTMGRTTAPMGFILSDGAILGVSAAYFTDRDGQVYQGKFIPQELIVAHDNPILRDNSVPQEAIDWLLAQPTCQNP